MTTRSFNSLAPVDLARSISSLGIPGDPSIAIDGTVAWLATRTPEGPGTARFAGSQPITVEAWGPGAEWLAEHAPAICGAEDDPAGFEPGHPVVRHLARQHPGTRITRTGLVVEALVRTVVGQRVTGADARKAYRRMTAALGGPAPGPIRLSLPPDPAALAALGYSAFHGWGIERARAETIIRVSRHARRIEETAGMPLGEAYARMTAVPGIALWTAGTVGSIALGDADAVPIGDYNLPNGVAWALAGEARGDDARMLELLEPFRPHRARVVRLLHQARIKPPRYGPRLPRRRISRQ